MVACSSYINSHWDSLPRDTIKHSSGYTEREEKVTQHMLIIMTHTYIVSATKSITSLSHNLRHKVNIKLSSYTFGHTVIPYHTC